MQVLSGNEPTPGLVSSKPGSAPAEPTEKRPSLRVVPRLIQASNKDDSLGIPQTV